MKGWGVDHFGSCGSGIKFKLLKCGIQQLEYRDLRSRVGVLGSRSQSVETL